MLHAGFGAFDDANRSDVALIARTKDGRVHRLRHRAQPMRDAAAWMAYYQQFWDTRLDALDHYLHHVDPTDEQKEQPS